MADERTPLTANIIPPMELPPGPSYVFPRGSRSQQRQVRKLQCCICAAFMAVFAIAIVITISYSMAGESNENNAINQNETIISTTISTVLDGNEVNSTDFLLLLQWPIGDEQFPVWNLSDVKEEDKENAISYGKKALGDRELLEENMSSPKINSPSYKHQRAVSTTREARIVTKRGYIENHATHALANRFKTNMEVQNPHIRWTVGKGPEINFNQSTEILFCDFNAKYRTVNGTCNNRNHPSTYGVAMRPFRRALYPDYADGISAPRGSYNGSLLPSARQISIQVHRPSYESDPNFTVMLAVYGQFLDHDITATAGTQGEGGEPIECCDKTKPQHPECFPVPLDKGDPFFDKYNMKCMNFIRSAPAPTGQFGPREQLNQATNYIDGSVVYGNTEERVRSLRTGTGGLLRMFNTPDDRKLLPISTDTNDGCNEYEQNQKGEYCFESGDARANENLHLTSMHLIFARHHNYLAMSLAKINPSWDDETLYQEARKILGAQMQHITYNEFLPILLGETVARSKGIISNSSSEDKYDEKIDATIANNFAASSFRFAHTLLPGLMKVTDDENNPDGLALHKMLFNPYSLYKEKGLDNALAGAINTPLAKSDPYFTKELSEKLFENSTPTPDHVCGLDLVSLNIQRGRDHGLPSYKEWRKHCRLPPTETWKELKNALDAESFNRIQIIYKSLNDIDLYTGALSEPPLEGAITGALLACLIGDQFHRLKFGDSFWYERKIGPQRFSHDQLQQLYNTTLAAILCQNSDNVTESQKYVMKVVDATNPILNCTEINNFDFSPWSILNNQELKPHNVKMHTDKTNVLTQTNKPNLNLNSENLIELN